MIVVMEAMTGLPFVKKNNTEPCTCISFAWSTYRLCKSNLSTDERMLSENTGGLVVNSVDPPATKRNRRARARGSAANGTRAPRPVFCNRAQKYVNNYIKNR